MQIDIFEKIQSPTMIHGFSMKMPFTLLIAFSVITTFISACSENADREKKLNSPKDRSNELIKVDLPESRTPKHEDVFTISVHEDDRYFIEGKAWEFDSIAPMLREKMNNDPTFQRIVRIEGDRMAHFEAVFRLLTLLEELQLKPAIAYKR